MAGDKPPLRVGLWKAVSTPQQARDDKVSLEQQETEGRAFADLHGGEVVKVYSVPGHSRRYVFLADAARDMPAYAELMADLEAGRLDVLFCHDEDRLGRRLALIAQVAAVCEDNGCEVYSQTTPHVLGSKVESGGDFMVALKGAQAEAEIRRLVYRHRTGMRARVLKRGLIPTRCPFWLAPIRNPHTGQIDAYEFSSQVGALDLMTQMFLAGHSYGAIVVAMRASPWPPPGGRQWGIMTVRNTLAVSNLAAGIPRYGGLHPELPSSSIPARWDESTFAAVLRERARRQRVGHPRNTAGPLSGVAFCAKCGSPMYRMWRQDRGYYIIRCGRHARVSIGAEPCHANWCREEAVIGSVASWLDDLLTEDAIDAALADYGAVDPQAAGREDLQRQADDLAQQRDRLALAYRQGRMPIDLFSTQLEEVDRLLAVARDRQQELERAATAAPDLDEMREMLRRLGQSFRVLVRRLDGVEMSTLLQAAGIVVLCESGEVVSVELAV